MASHGSGSVTIWRAGMIEDAAPLDEGRAEHAMVPPHELDILGRVVERRLLDRDDRRSVAQADRAAKADGDGLAADRELGRDFFVALACDLRDPRSLRDLAVKRDLMTSVGTRVAGGGEQLLPAPAVIVGGIRSPRFRLEECFPAAANPRAS